MENDFSKWREWMKGQVKYYVCFRKAAVSLAGVILCYNVVNYNVVGVLVTYFTDAFNQDAIHKSAVLVNVLLGMQVVVLAFTWAYSESFGIRKIIIFSTAVYVLGLLMLYLSASNRIPKTNFVLYLFACVLIAAGKAGPSILKIDLLDQLIAGHENIEQIDWKQARCRRNVWLFLAGVLIVIIPFTENRSTMFVNSMCVIGAAGFISLVSRWFFHHRHPTRTENNIKAHFNCFKKDRETLPPDQPAEAQAQQEQLPLIRMIPMWSTFIVFGLVISTAETFFNLQDDSMESHVTTSNFLLGKDALKVAADFLCIWFLELRKLSRSEKNFVLKMIICLGMVLSVICPSLAWQVEVQRLKKAHELGLVGKPKDKKVLMSDWCMAPLFGLWGVMEGLSVRGLDEFFNYHVSKSMEDCGSEIYNKIPIAIGNLLSAVCVSTCKRWFGDTLNQSRLDNYWQMITVLAWINLCWFFLVTTFYSTKAEDGVELQESQEESEVEIESQVEIESEESEVKIELQESEVEIIRENYVNLQRLKNIINIINFYDDLHYQEK